MAAITGPGSQPADEATPRNQAERRFGWWDMFVHPDQDPREDGPFAGERAILVGYLRDRRLTLELKCEDLDAAAMARRSVEPSNLSLLGLVRHLAGVEQYWFRKVMAGQEVTRPYRSADGSNAEFDGAMPDPAMVAEAWGVWRAEVAFAEQFLADAPDLGVTGADGAEPISLREVMVHMIEEYARHLGHADLLRERIDGRVGQ